MGNDISSGSVADCLLRSFQILKDILSSAKLHYGIIKTIEPKTDVITL